MRSTCRPRSKVGRKVPGEQSVRTFRPAFPANKPRAAGRNGSRAFPRPKIAVGKIPMRKPYSDCTRLYGPNPRHAFPDELSAHKKRGRQKICRPRIRNGSAFGRVCAARSEPTNGRKHAEANMSYSISTNWLSTATVSPSATNTCLTVPA